MKLPIYTLEEIKKIDLSHALRPEFTLVCLKKLAIDKEALNIFGENGSGKRRLLKDLSKVNLPNALFIHQKIEKSYATFLKNLSIQYGMKHNESLGAMLGSHSTTENKIIFLLIEGIDKLYDESGKANEGYENFFSQLNGLKNSNYCRIACISELPKGTHFKEVSSPLTFDRKKINDISYEQIKNEILRLYPNINIELINYLTEQCETRNYIFLKDLAIDLPKLTTKEDAKRYIRGN